MTTRAAPSPLACFAVTAPGLEPICAAELAGLGIRGTVGEGGVTWTGSIESVARANLWLRTASRVLVRVAEFKATQFFELELHAKRIPWATFVGPSSRVEFRVTCRKSKLYHSDAVAERFGKAVTRAVPGALVGAAAESEDDDSSPSAGQPGERQLFVVRFVRDVCTVSVDTSGALLHFRGYRQQLAKAPLRETLAAAILLGAGWTGDSPLVDPMCGSGTIPIEAALIARRMAPGRDRTFAFLHWPGADHAAWRRLSAEAKAGELARSPVEIEGSDRDDGAIAAARANAERAGVGSDVNFVARAISALGPALMQSGGPALMQSGGPAMPPGLIAANPPYGIRIGESEALRNLYAQLGNVVRRNRPGWTLALLSADRDLDRQVALDFEERLQTRNGGIPVHLAVARIPSPSSRPSEPGLDRG